MTKYNFYADPINKENPIIVIAYILEPAKLEHLLTYMGRENSYVIKEGSPAKDSLVEDYHFYNSLKVAWSGNISDERARDEDTMNYKFFIDAQPLVKGLRNFLNKPFIPDDFKELLNQDKTVGEVYSSIFEEEDDFELYFGSCAGWTLTGITISKVRKVSYTYCYE